MSQTAPTDNTRYPCHAMPHATMVEKMSFLDNLENSLKALEGTEGSGFEDTNQRNARRNDERAAAPWAAKLKTSDWTAKLMREATVAGHKRRVRIGFFWLGATLRLEAVGQRLDLKPSATGIDAQFLVGNEVKKSIRIDLDGDPTKVLGQWLQVVDAEKSQNDAEAARLLEELKDEIAE